MALQPGGDLVDLWPVAGGEAFGGEGGLCEGAGLLAAGGELLGRGWWLVGAAGARGDQRAGEQEAGGREGVG